jgi:hypothetical protein
MAFSELSRFLLFSFQSNRFHLTGLGTICIVLHSNEKTQKGKREMADASVVTDPGIGIQRSDSLAFFCGRKKIRIFKAMKRAC